MPLSPSKFTFPIWFYRGRKPLLALAFAGLSVLGANYYHYGMWNQFFSLPWLYDLAQPDLYPHDQLVAQGQAVASLFYPFLLGLHQLLGLSWPVLFLTVYFLCLGAFFWALQCLGQHLFGQERAGLMVMVAASLSYPVIADIFLWDSLLMERVMTLPLLLWSLHAALRGHYRSMGLLQGLAFAFHPLSAIFLTLASGLALLASRGLVPRLWQAAGLFLLPALPVVYWQMQASQESLFAMSATWLSVMELRNAHHAFPTAYPLGQWLKTLLLLGAYFPLVQLSGLTRRYRRYFHVFGLVIVLFLLVGFLFTTLWPLKLVIVFQFFRSFKFLHFLFILLWGGLIATRPRPAGVLLGLALALQFVYGEWAKTAAALFLLTVCALACRYLARRWVYGVALGSYLLISLGALYMRGLPSWDRGSQPAPWYALQEWVRQHTPHSSLFIVPPQEAGFRVESRRSTYVTWFEGTRAFFSEAYARTWWQRLQSLGTTHPKSLPAQYRQNEAPDFQRIATEMATRYPHVFVVTYRQHSLELPLVYQNRDWALYRVPLRRPGGQM